VKGLAEIVVGARLEAGDALVPGVAGGEDDDRDRVAGGAPALQDLEAGQAGQAEIEDHRVVSGLAAEELAVDPVVGCVRGVAGALQVRGEVRRQRLVVLDQQQSHRCGPAAASATSPRKVTARPPLRGERPCLRRT
jgi:hypothetical protein